MVVNTVGSIVARPLRAGKKACSCSSCTGKRPTASNKPNYQIGPLVLGYRDPKAKLGEERLRNFGLFEKNAGYTQPYRETYIHRRCGTIHRLNVVDAEAFAIAPTFFHHVHCDYCGDWYSPSQFIWNDGKGTKMGSRQNYE